MKRSGPLKTDAVKLAAWQARGVKKYAQKIRSKPFPQTSRSNQQSPMPMAEPAHKPSYRRRNDGPWRNAVVALRGAYCRGCLSTVWLQADHIFPRGQGGPSVVENGLMLCESCHRAKTESRIVIEFAWLDADQIPWLARIGWVTWDGDGQPRGRGWRHFGTRNVRVMMKGGEDGSTE